MKKEQHCETENHPHNCGCHCCCHGEHETVSTHEDDSGSENTDDPDGPRRGGSSAEEDTALHDHSHDPDLKEYRTDVRDVMKMDDEIDADERRALGHYHEDAQPHHVPGHPADCRCPGCEEDLCDYCGKELSDCSCEQPRKGYRRKIYRMTRLDCPVCAAKMEKKIRELPSVTFASVSFLSKQLRVVSSSDPDFLVPDLLRICRAIDSAVGIEPWKASDSGSYRTEMYLMPTLDCAACAAKLEQRINRVPGVVSATLSYATKQLRLTAENPDALIPAVTAACNETKAGTVIEKKAAAPLREEPAPPIYKTLFSRSALVLAAGAVLFAAGIVMTYLPGRIVPADSTAADILLLASYALLGGRVIITALRNLFKGEVFDENFLMTLATAGAVAIHEIPEAAGVMLFYRIGEYLEDRASDRSRKQIMNAVDMRPETVTRTRGGETEVIPAGEAQIGDILMIRAGERIPLDGIVTEGASQLDTSPITGEPVPRRIQPGDSISSGCINQGGLIRMRVEKVLAESMVTRILDSVENAVANKPKMDRFITRFSRIYTPAVVFLAVFIALVPSFITGNWNYWIYTALTFLVISCPCALVLSVPLSFFSGIGAGSRLGILFKGGTSMEAVSRTDAVAMDKTGTLTKGHFAVQEVRPFQNLTSGAILALAAGAEQLSTHPIAASIVTAAKEKNLPFSLCTELEETAGEGLTCITEGQKAAVGNRRLMNRLGISLQSLPDASSGGTEVLVALNGVLTGQILISDTVKPDAAAAVGQLTRMGLSAVMLTGDTPQGAEAVARETGISDVRAGLLPQDKLKEMNRIRSNYGSVMFVGDGINDAPVLAGADAGAAMGSGADAAIEAADIVFLNSEVRSIPQSITLAKAVMHTAWQNVLLALIVKISVMALGLFGYASMWMAVFADTGVTILCIMNSVRLLYKKFD